VDQLEVAPKDSLPKGVYELTTLNFKDSDLRDIFRVISLQHHLNIFLDNAINQKATIALSNVQVYDAIQFLVKEYGLTLAYGGGIFTISPLPPPVVVPPPPKVPSVFYDGVYLTINTQGDEIETVVEELHKKCGRNILLLSGTTGKVTGTLSRIDFDQGFTHLMNNNGFAVQLKGGVYIVSRQEYFVGTQGKAESTPTGPYWVSVQDSLVTMDVTNAPLDRILPDIVRQLNRDVVFYNSVTGVVSARATNISLERALDLLLRNTNFTYRESDGLYFIGEKTNKALSVTKLMKLKYLRAEKITELIPQSISSAALIKPVKEHNGFVMISSQDVIVQMEELLAEIDKPVAQVLIEALVVDYDLTDITDLGIQAGLLGRPDTSGVERSGTVIPGLDFSATGPWINRQLQEIGTVTMFNETFNVAKYGVLPADFYLKVQALEEKGLANIRSRPLLATLNGQQATLSIGTTQYYLLKSTIPYQDQNQVKFQESETFQTIEADVKLEITPYVGANNMITLEIKPDFRQPVGQFSSTTPPTINRRALSSTLILKEGETIILGGLIGESEVEARSQVPILGDIPLIGTLFSSTHKENRKAELLIYVTPRISYGEPFQNAYMNPDEDR
jgi:type IV pilus assembly protein PilQ